MFRLVLLLVALSGLQAVPIRAPTGLQKSSSTYQLPHGFQAAAERSDVRGSVLNSFKQGTEPSRRLLVDLNSGLVREHASEMERRHWLTDEGPAEVPVQKNGGGWVRVEERSHVQDGFRQGTEPFMPIKDGFRQGTEPFMRIQDGFRQGTEPFMRIQDGFRQGTEPFMRIQDGFRQGTEPFMRIQDGFRQGTEPFMRIQDGFRQGTEPFMPIRKGFRQGTEPTAKERKPRVACQGEIICLSGPAEVPVQKNSGGWVHVEERSHVQDGFRQGTEPFMPIKDGFRQGTEPFMRIQDGFRQGTEPFMRIQDGFRQGTEPFMRIQDGFRQGTEPFVRVQDGFRQGTEPFMPIKDGFRQGTEPFMPIRKGFRQGTEPTAKEQKPRVACQGEIINGNCNEFNPTPLSFRDAQAKCRTLAPNAELASVTSGELHSRLVSLVTKGGKRNPVLTWLGATVKKQQASWVDGSKWGFSDWMPGHPNIHTDKHACVEMFKQDQSWWTIANCNLKRASICTYTITA